jgi:hypothetical protein
MQVDAQGACWLDADEHHMGLALRTSGPLNCSEWKDGRQALRLGHDASLEQAGAQHSLSPVMPRRRSGDCLIMRRQGSQTRANSRRCGRKICASKLVDPVIAADGCKNLLVKISGKKRKFCPNIKGLFRKRNMAVRILQGQPGSSEAGEGTLEARGRARQWPSPDYESGGQEFESLRARHLSMTSASSTRRG